MSKRILVVEDQPDNRQIIRDMLAPTDYEITEAENGEQALAVIAKQRPDLILMDIQLPIMDGYTATRRQLNQPRIRSYASPCPNVTARKFWRVCAKSTFSLEKSPSLKKTTEIGKLQP